MSANLGLDDHENENEKEKLVMGDESMSEFTAEEMGYSRLCLSGMTINDE